VRWQLFVLARKAVLPQAVRPRTSTTLREKLVKIGAKVVRRSRKRVFQLAEVAVQGELFRAILEGIGRLKITRSSIRMTGKVKGLA
jgi:Transposase DDE domain group 1